MNDGEREQFDRETRRRAVYAAFNRRFDSIKDSVAEAIKCVDRRKSNGDIAYSIIMVDDAELLQLRSAGQITLSGPTIDGKVVVVTLRATGKQYSGLEGKQFRP